AGECFNDDRLASLLDDAAPLAVIAPRVGDALFPIVVYFPYILCMLELNLHPCMRRAKPYRVVGAVNVPSISPFLRPNAALFPHAHQISRRFFPEGKHQLEVVQYNVLLGGNGNYGIEMAVKFHDRASRSAESL